MKKFIGMLLLCVVCVMLVACGSESNHDGEVKTPSDSSSMAGDSYTDVMKEFEDAGFTNIKLEKIEDLITGWFTKDGEG